MLRVRARHVANLAFGQQVRFKSKDKKHGGMSQFFIPKKMHGISYQPTDEECDVTEYTKRPPPGAKKRRAMKKGSTPSSSSYDKQLPNRHLNGVLRMKREDDYAKKVAAARIFEFLQSYNGVVDIPGLSEVRHISENRVYKVFNSLSEAEINHMTAADLEIAFGSYTELIGYIMALPENVAQGAFDHMLPLMAEGIVEGVLEPNRESFELLPDIDDEPLVLPGALRKRGGFVEKKDIGEFEEDIMEDIWEDVYTGEDDVAADDDGYPEDHIVEEELTSLHLDEISLQSTIAFYEFFDEMEEEMSPNKEHAERIAQRFRAVYMTTDKIDEMYALHKKDPQYYTGERLGDLFNISRDRAWSYLVAAEYAESLKYGLPFNMNKHAVLFPDQMQRDKQEKEKLANYRSQKESTRSRNVDNLKTSTERDIYKQFVEESSYPATTSVTDDDLPDWVKIPHYVSGGSEQVKRPLDAPTNSLLKSMGIYGTQYFEDLKDSIPRLERLPEVNDNTSQKQQEEIMKVDRVVNSPITVNRIPNKSGLGTSKNRARFFVVEMARRSGFEGGEKQRKHFVIEKSGQLRLMDEEERMHEEQED
ncbi:UDP-3-O-(3-hydroxymyristoyl) N-acetylglucosamine deacetylase [Acrasis kona]|uniref:UDP-3-O-(3-hydroxymyristoyl) N-acetylglucosamine deacetylase n=1 Tax=Acrasis kona TaxID=1008807 RepID=A0AAW2YVX3_9EUKA